MIIVIPIAGWVVLITVGLIKLFVCYILTMVFINYSKKNSDTKKRFRYH